MAVTIGTNIPALTTIGRLRKHSDSVAQSFERLSSGLRINSAADDAAGLAIAQDLNTDVRVYTQALRNVNDSISALNIAEGGLEQLTSVLIRQRELATQSANGTFSRLQRLSLQEEATSLTQEFNRIVESLEFNGIGLFGSELDNLRVQAGYGLDGSIAIDIGAELTRTAGDGSFEVSSSTSAAGGRPFLEDFDSDGILDLMVLATGSTTFYKGNGDGTLQNGTSVGSLAVPAGFAVTGDFDNDGNIDFAYEKIFGTAIAYGKGDGTFESEVTISDVGTSYYAFAAGDVNNDGVTDLVVESTVYLSQGDRSFSTKSLADASSEDFTYLADFNGDGNLDIFQTIAGDNLRIMTGDGNGNFSELAQVADLVTGAVEYNLGDLNNDGLMDIVVRGTDSVEAHFANEDGTFQSAYSLTVTDTNVRDVVLGDTNGDGLLDIMAVGSSGTVDIWYTGLDGSISGTGSFDSTATQSFTHISFGDMDQDGVSDIVVNPVLNFPGAARLMLGGTQETATVAYLDLTGPNTAKDAMDSIDAVLERLAREKGLIGAGRSRLESTLATLGAASLNFEAAKSRIQDADVAQEAASLVLSQIRQQASAAVLSQANLLPNLALSLLS